MDARYLEFSKAFSSFFSVILVARLGRCDLDGWTIKHVDN